MYGASPAPVPVLPDPMPDHVLNQCQDYSIQLRRCGTEKIRKAGDDIDTTTCCSACSTEQNCTHWTVKSTGDDAGCYLHTGEPMLDRDNTCMSGVRFGWTGEAIVDECPDASVQLRRCGTSEIRKFGDDTDIASCCSACVSE